MFGLTPADKVALAANRPVLEAEDRLAAGNVPDRELFDLVKLVHGEDAAFAAAEARARYRLARGETPDLGE